jgi:prephenate dehydrogenase
LRNQQKKNNVTPTIAILGLGVIGGSLCLALKNTRRNLTIVGYDTKAVLRQALKRKIIDRAGSTVKNAVRDADFVFLCTPLSSILKQMREIAVSMRPGTIVTDVGSVKGNVVNAASRIFSDSVIFVGGHPMTGSEKSGLAYADPLLFQNAVYVLTPQPKAKKKIAPLVTLLQSIGARILFMNPAEHDRAAAAISHLPQLLSVGMMNYTLGKNSRNPNYLQLAAGGFRDITRIASSPYTIWNDILRYNNKEIGNALGEFDKLMRELKKELSQNKYQSLAVKFRRAKKNRDAIPKNMKGFLHPLTDILVWVIDEPGVLARITSSLFTSHINISDIELLKIREGEGGTFRLSFENLDAAKKAARILRAEGFKVEV